MRSFQSLIDKLSEEEIDQLTNTLLSYESITLGADQSFQTLLTAIRSHNLTVDELINLKYQLIMQKERIENNVANKELEEEECKREAIQKVKREQAITSRSFGLFVARYRALLCRAQAINKSYGTKDLELDISIKCRITIPVTSLDAADSFVSGEIGEFMAQYAINLEDDYAKWCDIDNASDISIDVHADSAILEKSERLREIQDQLDAFVTDDYKELLLDAVRHKGVPWEEEIGTLIKELKIVDDEWRVYAADHGLTPNDIEKGYKELMTRLDEQA